MWDNLEIIQTAYLAKIIKGRLQQFFIIEKYIKFVEIYEKNLFFSGLGNVRRPRPGDFVIECIISAGHCLKLRLRKTYLPDFGMLKYADNLYYCTKNQVCRLCVGGDMAILVFGSFHGKMTISPPTHNPRT